MKKQWLALSLVLALLLGLCPGGVVLAASEESGLPEGYVFIVNNYWTGPLSDGGYEINIVNADGELRTLRVDSAIRDTINADRIDTYADGWSQNRYVGKFCQVTAMDENGVVTALEPVALQDVTTLGDSLITLSDATSFAFDSHTSFYFVDLAIEEGEDDTTPADDTLRFSGSGLFNPDNFFDPRAVEPQSMITQQAFADATRSFDFVRAAVIPSQEDSSLAEAVYVLRAVWDYFVLPPLPTVKAFTDGFIWSELTDSASGHHFVAPTFASDVVYTLNGAIQQDDTELRRAVCEGSQPIPGAVVTVTRNENNEISAVSAIVHSVAQLTADPETRTAEDGALQLRFPGVAELEGWTDTAKISGDYETFQDGDVILYYVDPDGVCTLERAPKITGRVSAVNSLDFIFVNAQRYTRTGLRTVPPSATLGYTHPAYAESGDATFAHWGVTPGTEGGHNKYDFYLDKNGDICFIQLAPTVITDLTLSDDQLKLTVGDTHILTATVECEDPDNDEWVYWTSDNEAVVSVSQAGSLTALKAGSATVTVKSAYADLSATCLVTVTEKNSGSSSGSGSGGGSKPSSGSRPSGGGGGGDLPVAIIIEPDPAPAPASQTFVDVAVDSWYEPGITFVVSKGLFQGVAQDLFAPQDNMTRAMLMTVLARLDGQDTSGGESWYQKGMDWAVEHGISDGTFPDNSVTREQLAAMLYRYAGATAPVDADLAVFPDGASVSPWAADAMAWAVQAGIITGKDGGFLDPQGVATRAEVAAMLQRYTSQEG